VEGVGQPPKSSDEEKGIAVSSTYQEDRRRGQSEPRAGEVAMPEQVVVSMSEIAESAREGLLALEMSTGLQVMAGMFDDRTDGT
jgi:hypothetical protein